LDTGFLSKRVVAGMERAVALHSSPWPLQYCNDVLTNARFVRLSRGALSVSPHTTSSKSTTSEADWW
jgi:hypothetical protein